MIAISTDKLRSGNKIVIMKIMVMNLINQLLIIMNVVMFILK